MHRRWVSDLVIGLSGLALTTSGAVAVFAVNEGVGPAALVTTGAALLAVLALGDRLESLHLGNVELTLRREAEIAAAAGDETLEQNLRAAANSLADRAAPIAGSYEAVRGAMGAGHERTRAMTAEIKRAREDARSGDVTAEDVEDLFRSGSDGQRIYAIGAMQGRPDLADAQVVIDAVRGPRTPFEHYNSLRLAEDVLPQLSSAEQEALIEAVRHVIKSLRVRRDGDRMRVAQRILSESDRD